MLRWGEGLIPPEGPFFLSSHTCNKGEDKGALDSACITADSRAKLNKSINEESNTTLYSARWTGSLDSSNSALCYICCAERTRNLASLGEEPGYNFNQRRQLAVPIIQRLIVRTVRREVFNLDPSLV